MSLVAFIAVVVFLIQGVASHAIPDEPKWHEIKHKDDTVKKSLSNSNKHQLQQQPSTVGDNVYYDINDNRLLDTDALKRKKAKIARLTEQNTNNVIAKKDNVGKLENITDNTPKNNNKQKPTPNSHRSAVGKPYGDPENYQNIGDGIFLMNDDIGTGSSHTRQQQPLSSSPLSPVSIGESNLLKSMNTVKNIDKQGNNIAAEKVGEEMQVEHLPKEKEYNDNIDVSAHNSMQSNNVEFTQNGNIEGLSPSEVNMINTMQGQLNQEDRLAGSDLKQSSLSPFIQGFKSNDNGGVAVNFKKDSLVNKTMTNQGSNSKPVTHESNRSHEISKLVKNKETLNNIGTSQRNLENTKRRLNVNNTKFNKTVSISSTVGNLNHNNSQRKDNVPQYFDDHSNDKGFSLPAVKRIIIEQDEIVGHRTNQSTSAGEEGNLYYYGSTKHSKKTTPGTNQQNNSQIDGLINILNKTDDDGKFSRKKTKHQIQNFQQYHQQLEQTQHHDKQRNQQNHQIRSKDISSNDQKHQNFMQNGGVKIKSTSNNEKVIDVTGKKGLQIDLYIGGNKNTKGPSTPTATDNERDVKSNVMEDGDVVLKTSPYFPSTTIYSGPNGELNTNGIVTAPEVPSTSDGDNDSGKEDVTVEKNERKAQSKMFSSSKQESNTKSGSNIRIEGNEEKATTNELEDAISNDAIDNAEIRTAMAESDLRGLNQIKNALDDQDTKNSVEYYNQPALKPSKTETTLNELSEEFKEAEKNIEGYGSNGDPSSNSGNVKIVLHLPDHGSINKLEKSKNQTVDQKGNSEKQMSRKKSKNESKGSIDAVNMIANLIEKESLRKEIASNTQPIKEDSVGQSVYDYEKTPAAATENLLKEIIDTDSFRNYFIHPTVNKKEEEKVEDARQKMNIEKIVKDVLKQASAMKGKINPNPEPGNLKGVMEELDKKSDDDHKPNPLNINFGLLKINGAKVLGGNVRGGSILGGTITGGSILGGNINGGSISGGIFKNGLLENGDIKNGLVEGGKIRGGQILGGDVKSGLIDGGIVKGGTVDGGHLINGSVEGGKFKGGEILGGKLLSGEMDGGILKNGTINGGTLKGGVIESGSLDGGVMLAGTLRGGIVKSGTIRGGTIDKGVVIQDTDVGPGVEIEEGFIKGGRITVKDFNHKDSISDPADDGKDVKVKSDTPYKPKDYSSHTDKYRSNIEYHIEVLPRTLEPDHKAVATVKEDPPNSANSNEAMGETPSEHSVETHANIPKTTLETRQHASQMSLYPTARFEEAVIRGLKENQHKFTPKNEPNKVVLITNSIQNIKPSTKTIIKDKHLLGSNLVNIVPHVAGSRRQLGIFSSPQQPLLNQQQMQNQQQPQLQLFQQQPTSQLSEATITPTGSLYESLSEHWELTGAVKNYILGNPGPKLFLSRSGVSFRNGHAILDGRSGYLDAGDYQGECFSDPEACDYGFTIHMTLKVYRDSVDGKTKLFIVDSGAISKDSRGISVWVNENKISALIITRDNSWCITKDLGQYADRWMVLTLAWRKDKGAFLYFDCSLYDDSKKHFTHECEPQCPTCHKTDVATRMMFGRPNKGPHFRVTHMAIGDISLYERYFEKDEVELMCGDQESKATVPGKTTQTGQQQSPQQQQQQQNNKPAQQQKPQLQQQQQQQLPDESQQLVALPHPDTVKPDDTTEEHKPPAVVVSYLHSDISGQPVPPENQPNENTVAVVQVIPSISASAVLSAEQIAKTKAQVQPQTAPATAAKGQIRSKGSTPSEIAQYHKQHDNDDDGEFVYPTPPGISSNFVVRVTEAPTPLVNYTTDRRSNLYSRRRIKLQQQNLRPQSSGYSIWSAWSPCSRSCGDGIQTSVRFCQNKDHDCSSEGPPKKYRRCMLKSCQGTTKSMISYTNNFMNDNMNDQNLKLELNQLKRRR